MNLKQNKKSKNETTKKYQESLDQTTDIFINTQHSQNINDDYENVYFKNGAKIPENGTQNHQNPDFMIKNMNHFKNRDTVTDQEEEPHLRLFKSRIRNFQSMLCPQILEKYSKFGPWKPYENSSFESGFFSFVPDAYFKWRNIVTQPLTYYPFVCLKLCYGELIFLTLMTLTTLILGIKFCVSDYKNKAAALGHFASVLFALSFISAGKNLSFQMIIGMPFQRQVMFHKYIAFLGLSVSIAHGIVLGHTKYNNSLTSSGMILTLIVCFMICGSFLYVRRNFYRVFYVLHIMSIPALIYYSFKHQAKATLFGALFWGVDLLIRAFLILRFYLYSKSTQVFLMPGGFLRVKVSPKHDRKFKFKAGQIVYVNIPAVSLWEWHPFAVCTTSFDRDLIVHFKVFGGWTERVRKLCKTKGKEKFIKKQTLKLPNINRTNDSANCNDCKVKVLDTLVLINGPYGCPRVNVDSPKYKVFLLITGGIGVTNIHSIFNELVIQHIRGRPFVKIKLVWALRKRDLVHVVAGQRNSVLGQLPRSIWKVKKASFENVITFKINEVIETEIHITQGADQNIKADLERQYRIKVTLGRPDLGEVFESLGSLSAKHDCKRVGVLTCGPEELIYDCYRQSFKSSRVYVNTMKDGSKKKKKVTFDFHNQVLEF